MYQRILAVVDDQSNSRAAVTQAIDMAKTYQAELLLFYVLTPVNPPTVDFPAFAAEADEDYARAARSHASQVLQTMSELAEASGVHSLRAMGESYDTADCVSEAATKRQCDVIVVGSDRSNAVMRILGGSIVPGLITRATVPVLVVKEPACATRRFARGGKRTGQVDARM